MNSTTPTKPTCHVDYGTPSRPDFHGNPEDVGLFLQSVDKWARSQKPIPKPETVALYAASRLDGEARRWYNTLKPRVKKDWELLSAALCDRFQVLAQSPAGLHQPFSTSVRQQEPGMSPQYPSNWRYGHTLAVDEETGRSLGVVQGASLIEKSLGYWPTLGLLSKNVNDAMGVRVPRHGQGLFCVPITHHDPDVQAANPDKLAWRYLGIRYVQQPATRSASAPDQTDEADDSDDEASTAAKKKQKTSEATSSTLDTWALAECAESKPKALFKYRAEAINHPDAVASSRVWSLRTRDDDVEELCLTWLENGGATSELGAYVPYDTARTSKISIFRCADFDRFGEDLRMKRVRFVFIPNKTSKDVVVPMMVPTIDTCSDVAGPSAA